MFWKITLEERTEAPPDRPANWEGRFVLQRHCDGDGPHLDLRLEQDGYLLGWRIDGVALEAGCWATEKAPHPLHWLDHDGDTVREDGGVYAWLERSADGGVLVLEGQAGVLRQVRVRREPGLPAHEVRAILVALEAYGVEAADAGSLIADGVTARRRAIERLCGLGRELDGSAFDEAVMRKTLSQLTLEEVHAQLRAYEVRFDQKYPPQPVSRPERLPDEAVTERADAAMAIVREV